MITPRGCLTRRGPPRKAAQNDDGTCTGSPMRDSHQAQLSGGPTLHRKPVVRIQKARTPPDSKDSPDACTSSPEAQRGQSDEDEARTRRFGNGSPMAGGDALTRGHAVARIARGVRLEPDGA